MKPTSQDFKNIMSRWATGVSVITTIDEAGEKYGFTANSFASVSLDPMLVSFCLNKNSRIISQFSISKKFAISILSVAQEEIARHFAAPTIDKFQNTKHAYCPRTNCPYIDGSLGWIECVVKFQYSGGDHDIFIGEVIGIFMDHTKSPLLYYDRNFHSMG